MFREMRRKRQELSREACEEILYRASSGVLAVSGAYAYAVPLSYVYCDGRIWFHSARAGHKLDAIRDNDRVSFCVIGQDQVVPEKYTTYFRSVIVFGKIRVLEDEEEIQLAIGRLAEKYSPQDAPARRQEEIRRCRSALCMLELSVEHMSGKEAIELVNA